MEQELLTLPEHLSSPPFVVGFLLLNLYIYMYVLSIVVCTFSFGHCVVCSSSIYGFSLPLRDLQALLVQMTQNFVGSIYQRFARTIAHFVPIG